MTKNYLRTFLSRCDVYVHIDSTKTTEFGQPCFSKFAFSLKIGYNSIVINGVTILHLIRFISERNKWFYTECDWSIQLYFSSYQQRRVFLSFGWFVTKVSFMSRVMCKSRRRGTRPPSSRYKTVRNILCLFVSQQTELIQSKTAPTSVTDLICKGTWSIN